MSSKLVLEEDDMFSSSLEETVKNFKEFEVKEEVIEETVNEIADDIPPSYVEVNLPSNGKIEGIPSKLHFRCYTSGEATKLNVPDEDKPKAICKVLTGLCWEKFDIMKLPTQDILFILYVIQARFINPVITKTIFIDDTLEDSELYKDENLEDVDIPINSLHFIYLGKDENDVDLKEPIKIPFTISDSLTNSKLQFKIASLGDLIEAKTYCKNFYRDELIKYAKVKRELDSIRKIRNDEDRLKKFEEYIDLNDDEVKEYYKFRTEYDDKIEEVLQCMQIVSFNGEVISSIEEKWKIYQENIPFDLWSVYLEFVNSLKFGLSDKVDVFSPTNKKIVTRRVGFQLSDFLHFNKPKNTSRYSIAFD